MVIADMNPGISSLSTMSCWVSGCLLITRPVNVNVFDELLQPARNREPHTINANPVMRDLVRFVMIVLPWSSWQPVEQNDIRELALGRGEVPGVIPPLVVEAVTHLQENLAWIIPVEAAERLAVVQIHAT